MSESKLFYVELKEYRESSEISLEDISDFTKIDIKYLLAIEEGDFSCLPNVYMRLFLRSYCEYLKVDAVKALNDYEFHTIGKISSESIISTDNTQDQDIEIDPSLSQDDLNVAPITKSQIMTIAATIIMLALAFYLISSITSTDTNSIKQSQNSLEEKYLEDKSAEISSNPALSSLPNQNLLSSKEFSSTPISSKSYFLNTEFPPYIFTIKALAQTKINIDNGGEQIINKIINEGDYFSFDVSSVIKFDLWSTSHITCKLNDINLSSTLFGVEEYSIRGSFESEDQKLYYQLHPQFKY
tara:strand:+ start:14402 stop:15295 length:894 start_codon:yes stop_codon:yes gene_type:complete